jgi:SHS2 domain-containing protein
MEGFEVLEHTADIGIRAFGQDAREALVNAARGMFSVITDISSVEPRETVAVRVRAPDSEALLQEWLEELLYQSQTRAMLFSRFAIDSLEGNSLGGRAWGERIDPERHELKLEIKAVTYHALRFGPAEDGWAAQAIFDV